MLWNVDLVAATLFAIVTKTLPTSSAVIASGHCSKCKRLPEHPNSGDCFLPSRQPSWHRHSLRWTKSRATGGSPLGGKILNFHDTFAAFAHELPSRSKILMQSPQPARTPRRTCSLPQGPRRLLVIHAASTLWPIPTPIGVLCF